MSEKFKLHIPKIGDQIKLTKDVAVTITEESRNMKFIDLILKNGEKFEKTTEEKLIAPGFSDAIKCINHYKIKLKAGTVLKFDRIFIRNGKSSEFDSITFKFIESDSYQGARFFISLEEANTFEVERG